MTVKIRFHLDENVHGGVALGLRSFGVDVTTAVEAGLLEATDQVQLQHCLTSGRVLVTHDDDFCRLNAAGHEHAGIAYCHRQKYSLGELLRILLLLHACYDAAEMRGQLEFL
jgi:hypothetical protein